MERRLFLKGIGGSLTAALVATYGNAVASIGEGIAGGNAKKPLAGILMEHLPRADDKTGLSFFMTSPKDYASGEFTAFTIEKTTNKMTTEEFFEFIETLPSQADLSHDDSLIEIMDKIMKEANLIARNTNRGRATKAIMCGNDILIWYQGNLKYDTPFRVCNEDESVFVNQNINAYFAKLSGADNLDENKKEKLAEMMRYQNIDTILV